jgi:hypothetical protein
MNHFKQKEFINRVKEWEFKYFFIAALNGMILFARHFRLHGRMLKILMP